MPSQSRTRQQQPLSAVYFGEDWQYIKEHVFADAPKDSLEPFITETRMLLLPHPVCGSKGIASTLLDKVAALIAAGDRGVPMDKLLMFWLHDANVDEKYIVIDGKPHIAIDPGSRIVLMFGDPDRWAGEAV